MNEIERLSHINEFLYASAYYLLLKEPILQRKPLCKGMSCTFTGRRLLEMCAIAEPSEE